MAASENQVNKPKAQGTRWESEFVRQAQDAGLMADRLAEGGSNDPGDVWIGDTPSKHGDNIAIVVWSRLVKGDGARRVADGARSVVILTTDDFLKVARDAGWTYVAECKAAERLNVTRVLDQAQRKLARWKER